MITDKFGRPLKDLRISVTDRCNFRCRYCMPAEIFGESYQFLPKEEILTFEEITRLARIFVGLGVTKIRLTGREPALRKELYRLVAMLAEIEGVEDLTLTTKGYLLAQQARQLKDAENVLYKECFYDGTCPLPLVTDTVIEDVKEYLDDVAGITEWRRR